MGRINSTYTAEFLANMPQKVNFILIDFRTDDGSSELEGFADVAFFLDSGKSNSKRWNDGSSMMHWGKLMTWTNAQVAKIIRDCEKEAEEHGGYANVAFGHKSEKDIHADWDWSEVQKGHGKWLKASSTSAPARKKSTTAKKSNMPRFNVRGMF